MKIIHEPQSEHGDEYWWIYPFTDTPSRFDGHLTVWRNSKGIDTMVNIGSPLRQLNLAQVNQLRDALATATDIMIGRYPVPAVVPASASTATSAETP